MAAVWPEIATEFLYHWKVGVGVPEAAAVKVTLAPAVTVCEEGWVVNEGATEPPVIVIVQVTLALLPPVPPVES